ncbi:hypothetical protein TCDM_01210 [Trypanosoma cruzi Dm28c]|uniref:Uncharacterized protein n=2 Tax=Trypanosoma cruzi TaxID=5693 RepID=V5BV66_TRYCR|nr:hypothetical protein TCDM_01210 [Trypanosoma cruzi Dm28c]KAF8288951.1 hypothetical protein TcBrA4_0003520 [Trypanosoma cruzi]PBJ71910.1 hypothetical protein BCY84_16130 [Trypanosoma cruzi cruzi]PWU98153.1 hypothetical protein C4B63_13g132 [Trypanosoma cruzi]
MAQQMRSGGKNCHTVSSHFHEGELARMQHTHELVRCDAGPRRTTVPSTAGGTSELPLSRRMNLPLYLRPRNNLETLSRFRAGPVNDWKNSLRRETVALPVLHHRFIREQNNASNINRVKSAVSAYEDGSSEKKNIDLDVAEPTVCHEGHEEPGWAGGGEQSLEDHVGIDEQRALKTLERLFIPQWRLHMQLKRRCKAPAKIYYSGVNPPSIRRTSVRDVAVDVILSFLRAGWWRPLVEFRRLKNKLLRIQRLFRRHTLCMDARVELNYRKVRTEFEQSYWKKVEEAHRQEMGEELFTGSDRNGGEMDIADFRLVGPLPELFLRRELRSALYCHAHRCLQEPTAARGRFFLPNWTYYAVLDNVCYITSVVRDSNMLRSHLSNRRKKIISY